MDDITLALRSVASADEREGTEGRGEIGLVRWMDSSSPSRTVETDRVA